MKKRIFSIVLAGILTGSIAVMGVSADAVPNDGNLGAFGTGFETEKDNTVENPIIKVVVPTTFDYAVDAFEQKDSGTQIYSTENYIINKSNVAVKTDIDMSVKEKASSGVVFEDSAADVAAAEKDSKSVWLAAVAATSITPKTKAEVDPAESLGLYMYWKYDTPLAGVPGVSAGTFYASLNGSNNIFDATQAANAGKIVYSPYASIDANNSTITEKTENGIAGVTKIYKYKAGDSNLEVAAGTEAEDEVKYSPLAQIATAVNAATSLTTGTDVDGLEFKPTIWTFYEKDGVYTATDPGSATTVYSINNKIGDVTASTKYTTKYADTISAKGTYNFNAENGIFTVSSDEAAPTTISFALAKANSVAVELDHDAQTKKVITTSVNSDSSTVGGKTLKTGTAANQGIAAFRFMGNVNDNIIWTDDMATITVKYTISGLSNESYVKAVSTPDTTETEKVTLTTIAHQCLATSAPEEEEPEVTQPSFTYTAGTGTLAFSDVPTTYTDIKVYDATTGYSLKSTNAIATNYSSITMGSATGSIVLEGTYWKPGVTKIEFVNDAGTAVATWTK